MTAFRDRLPAWVKTPSRIKLSVRTGDDNPMSALTDAQKAYIRRHHATGAFTQRELAAAYGVSPPVIHKAIRNPKPSETWSW